MDKLEFYYVQIELGKVLGTLKSAYCMDLETTRQKIEPFKMPNGEMLRGIQKPTMIGGCYVEDGFLFAECFYGWSNEYGWIDSMNRIAEKHDTIYFCGLRDFVEMVCKGKLTTTRRAHLKEPGNWPHIEEDMFNWVNLHKLNVHSNIVQGEDISGKEIAKWDGTINHSEEYINRIILHNMRDAINILERMGCATGSMARRFLEDNDFAYSIL